MRPSSPAGNRAPWLPGRPFSGRPALGARSPKTGGGMNIWKNLREKGAAFTVETLLQAPVENALARYGKVRGIALENGELRLSLALNGLEREVEIRCSDIDIAEDGSTVRIGTFHSDLACAEQALNDFATSPFPVRSGTARAALVLLRKLMF